MAIRHPKRVRLTQTHGTSYAAITCTRYDNGWPFVIQNVSVKKRIVLLRPLLHVRVRVRLYRARTRPRTRFFSWNSWVICPRRRTVQIECERERIFVRANGRLDCPQSEFCQKFARPFCYLPISKYFPSIIYTNRNVFVRLFQEKLGTSNNLLRLWSLEKNVQHNWQDSSKPWLLKLKRIMDCMTKQTRIIH